MDTITRSLLAAAIGWAFAAGAIAQSASPAAKGANQDPAEKGAQASPTAADRAKCTHLKGADADKCAMDARMAREKMAGSATKGDTAVPKGKDKAQNQDPGTVPKK